MPGPSCAFIHCKNNAKKTPHLSFHHFPKGGERRVAWIKFCNQGEKWSPNKTSTICSAHFGTNDFVLNFRAQLLKKPTKTMLKNDAIPWILDDDDKENIVQNEWKQKKKEILSEIWNQNTTTEKLCAQGNEPTSSNNMCNEANGMVKDIANISPENPDWRSTEWEEPTGVLQKQVDDLKQCNNELLKRIKEQQVIINNYKHRITDVEKQVHEHENCIKKTDLAAEIKQQLKGVLSAQQLDIILKLKKKVRWSQEDIAAAFTLRYFSKRAYLYMTNINYPLPDLSTLRRYAATFKIRNGVLNEVLRMMELNGKEMKPQQRATVLMYDEMKVLSTYEYDKQCDEIIGPYSQMQVVVARGLFADWKQPMFVDFDTKMTGPLLSDIIYALQTRNYTVVAVVSDCGSANQGVWRDLGASTEASYFQHPNSEQPVYFFADTPHLLKLIRNWLIDRGFVLEIGVIITKKPLLELLEKSEHLDISSVYKLTSKHVNCMGTERQNVLLASQLLSHTTATALLRYNDTSEAKHLSHFIDTVNAWFDLMNSYNLNASVHSKRPYKNLEEQNTILNNMYQLMSSVRCVGKQSLQVFQKAILMSINALKGLMKTCTETYDMQFLLTSKLNQDALENLFSQIRTRGGLDDHPTPLNALYRLRMLMLGKAPGIVQQKINYSTSTALSPETYVVGSVLKEACIRPHVRATELDDISGSDFDVSTSSGLSVSASGCTINDSQRSIHETIKLEDDGLDYLAGWLAKKFSRQYPHLGQYTYMLQREHDYCLPSWVKHISYGGLREPSSQLKKAVAILNHKFKKINKQSLKIKKNIVKRLTRKLRTYVDIPIEVIRAFVRQRIFIRIKYLNLKLSERRKPYSKLGKLKKICT